MSSQVVIAPGSTLGIFGSGQLGRMFTMVAKRMGYRVTVFSPDKDSPAGQVADTEIAADYSDQAAVEAFARQCDVITLEFENIPVETVRWANAITPVHPGEHVLEVAQDRITEKQTLAGAGLPVTPFIPVLNQHDLDAAVAKFGLPIVLKTARSGYDGKGQKILRTNEDVQTAIATLGSDRFVAEQMIDFACEVSILVYRNLNHGSGTYRIVENRHANHILDVSTCPATGAADLEGQAREIAIGAAERLNLIGILCIEFFVTKDQGLMINEIAPRPHNSGHLTIEAFPCSQYEQQLRCVCGLPLGDSQPTEPAAMVNLLGDLWEGGEPDFAAAITQPGVHLHLYGKQDAKPGRKMGHITAVASELETAEQRALAAREALRRR